MSIRRFRCGVLLAPTCLTLLLGLAESAHAATFNVAADFSFSNNPNGVWSYNAGSTPLPAAFPDWGGITGETFWAPSANQVPLWTRAQTTPSFASDWLPGDAIVHATTPSSGIGLANVTWTSPMHGTIDISGRIWDAFHYPDRDDRWALMLNGTVIAERATIRGIRRGDAEAELAFNLVTGQSLTGVPVNVGDVLTFETEALTLAGHFLGVDLTVDATPGTVPEPASVLLLASGLGGLLLARARRNKTN